MKFRLLMQVAERTLVESACPRAVVAVRKLLMCVHNTYSEPPSGYSMAHFERIRDVISGPFSPSLMQQRTVRRMAIGVD